MLVSFLLSLSQGIADAQYLGNLHASFRRQLRSIRCIRRLEMYLLPLVALLTLLMYRLWVLRTPRHPDRCTYPTHLCRSISKDQ